jgi:hypothetical protein
MSPLENYTQNINAILHPGGPCSSRDGNAKGKLLWDSNPNPALQASAQKLCRSPELSFKTICDEAVQDCTLTYGSPNCWDRDASDARWTDPAFRKRAFSAALTVFNDLKSRVLDSCCGEADTRCRKNFGNLKLEIALGLGRKSESAEFKTDRNEVVVSEAIVLNAYRPEVLEKTFLHEFGHACTSALGLRVPRVQKDCNNKDVLRDLARSMKQISKEEGDEAGVDLLSCFMDQTKAHMPQDVCLSQWFDEAVADMRFMTYWPLAGFASFFCNGVTDTSHGPGEGNLTCFLKNPQLETLRRAKFCQEGGEK